MWRIKAEINLSLVVIRYNFKQATSVRSYNDSTPSVVDDEWRANNANELDNDDVDLINPM
jgi:hypothetical protein